MSLLNSSGKNVVARFNDQTHLGVCRLFAEIVVSIAFVSAKMLGP